MRFLGEYRLWIQSWATFTTLRFYRSSQRWSKVLGTITDHCVLIKSHTSARGVTHFVGFVRFINLKDPIFIWDLWEIYGIYWSNPFDHFLRSFHFKCECPTISFMRRKIIANYTLTPSEIPQLGLGTLTLLRRGFFNVRSYLQMRHLNKFLINLDVN